MVVRSRCSRPVDLWQRPKGWFDSVKICKLALEARSHAFPLDCTSPNFRSSFSRQFFAIWPLCSSQNFDTHKRLLCQTAQRTSNIFEPRCPRARADMFLTNIFLRYRRLTNGVCICIIGDWWLVCIYVWLCTTCTFLLYVFRQWSWSDAHHLWWWMRYSKTREWLHVAYTQRGRFRCFMYNSKRNHVQ